MRVYLDNIRESKTERNDKRADEALAAYVVTRLSVAVTPPAAKGMEAMKSQRATVIGDPIGEGRCIHTGSLHSAPVHVCRGAVLALTHTSIAPQSWPTMCALPILSASKIPGTL